MSTKTTNYELVKIDLTDAPPDITAINPNWDKIDTELKAKDTALTGHINTKTNPHGVTKAQVGLGNVDNTSDANKPVSTATQTALNGKVPTTRTVNGKALSEDITLSAVDIGAAESTHNHSASNITAGTLPIARGGTSATTAAEALVKFGITVPASTINYLNGVNSNVQTQLTNKQDKITGAATSITSDDLSASKALVSTGSGKVGVSAVTSTELGYLDGVTSSVQNQLNNKLSTSGGTATGPINFINTDGTRAISKTRTVGSTTYFMDVGMGAYGGKATAYMRLIQGSDSNDTQLYRLDITANGVLLQNTAGNTFWFGNSAVQASVEA